MTPKEYKKGEIVRDIYTNEVFTVNHSFWQNYAGGKTADFTVIFEAKKGVNGNKPSWNKSTNLAPVLTDITEVSFIDFCHLTPEEAEEFDYLDTPEEANYFRFCGNVFELGQFMRMESPDENGFHGYYGMSTFHAVLVKINEGAESITVANSFS